MPVVNLQEATPELPPKSAVPRVDEESPEKEPEVGPAEDAAAESQGSPAAPERPVPEPLPEQERPVPLNPAVEPPPAPAPAPPAPAPPVAEPPAAKPNPQPKQDDLFDESATGPVPRRFIARNAASMTRPASPASRPAVRPATLTYPGSIEALPRSVDEPRPRVPRVPFDPAAEAARLGR